MMCCDLDMRIIQSENKRDGNNYSYVLTYECPKCGQTTIKSTPTTAPDAE